VTTDLRYENVTGDQRDLADVARKLFAGATADPLAGAELGWFGVGTQPELGGVGGSSSDLAILVEAAGAALATSCLGESALVTVPLLASHADADLLRRLLDGSLSVGLPVTTPWQVASAVAFDGALTGEIVVLGAERPDVLLVPARQGDDELALLLDANDGGISREALPSADVSRHLSRFRFEAAGSAVLSRARGTDLFTDFMARRAAAAALDAVGAARTAFDKTLGYAAVRTQFDQPIGSFQAYKHRCANAFIELKLAQSIAFGAASTVGSLRGSLLGLAAGRCATANATFICGEAVQLHGGIGFTWEAGLHAFLKRARMDEIIGRGCAHARARLMELDDLGSDTGRQD
jgi:alkylation response protein AidB-like acyl-CoA dehydrogenase